MKFNLNRQDPAAAIDSLNAGLPRLSFEDNFAGFAWEGELLAGEEKAIANKLRDKAIPTGYLVTYMKGENTLVAGDAEWDEKRVTLKNHGSNTIFVKVYFFR